MVSKRILLVEDEFLIRLTLADALTDEGFLVVEAGSGDEAAALLAGAEPFALLVTDIQLPGSLTGLQLASLARQGDPNFPVVFMTGRPDLVTAGDRGPHGAVMGKPYLPSDICQTAHRLLATAKPT